MNAAGTARELRIEEAVEAFLAMPPATQIATLHPQIVSADAARDPRRHPVFWQFEQGARRFLHCFHVFRSTVESACGIESAYGYGGPLSNSAEPEFIAAADAAFRDWARSQSVIAEFVRLHPMLSQGEWYCGRVQDNRETVYVDLKEDLLSQSAGRRRTDIRRFEESVITAKQVSASEMASVFPEMYRSNMDHIGAADEYFFSSAYFDALFGSPPADLWLAMDENGPLAGAVILQSRPAGSAEYHLGAKTTAPEASRAMIGLLYRVAQHYQALSYEFLYLGGGRSREPDDSLLFFKKGFSAHSRTFRTGSRIFDASRYEELKSRYPEQASTGRVLFFKDV